MSFSELSQESTKVWLIGLTCEQVAIKRDKSLPPKYVPKLLHTSNKATIKTFLNHYNQLFRERLEEVISDNVQSLSGYTVKLEEILSDTEKCLVTCEVPNEILTREYENFITHNNLQNHIPLPELQTRLTTKKSEIIITRKRKRKFRAKKQTEPELQPSSPKYKKLSSTCEEGCSFNPKSPVIHNLSTLILSESELSLLDKGLSFAPISKSPPDQQKLELLRSVSNFLSQQEWFISDTSTIGNHANKT